MAGPMQRPFTFVLLGIAGVCLAVLLLSTWRGDTPRRVAPTQEGATGAEVETEAPPLRQAGVSALGVVRPQTLIGCAAERRRVALRVAESGSLGAALAAVEHHRARGSRDMLEVFARHATDPRVRIRALRALAVRFGTEVRPFLVTTVESADESSKVRREAARLVGLTDGGAVLDRLIESDLPPRVRGGAVLGLAELRTAAGAARAFDLAVSREHPMRLEAAQALGRMFAPAAAERLAALLSSDGTAQGPVRLPEGARIAVCRSLAQSRAAAARAPLDAFLKTDESAAVRAAAAHALGILGRKDAVAALNAARIDPAPGVAAAADLALSRLAHARD